MHVHTYMRRRARGRQGECRGRAGGGREPGDAHLAESEHAAVLAHAEREGGPADKAARAPSLCG